MTITFTDKEKEWIDMKPFNWTIKKGCPESIQNTLEPKLKKLREETYEYNTRK